MKMCIVAFFFILPEMPKNSCIPVNSDSLISSHRLKKVPRFQFNVIQFCFAVSFEIDIGMREKINTYIYSYLDKGSESFTCKYSWTFGYSLLS